MEVQSEVFLPVIYDGIIFDTGYRIDILIENLVMIEIKSLENLLPVHHKQVLTYWKLSNLKLGLLINFNSSDISTAIMRKVNGF